MRDWKDIIDELLDSSGKKVGVLAKELGVDTRYIADLRAGRSRNPSSEFIASLVIDLGVSPVWLFSDSGSGPIFSDERWGLGIDSAGASRLDTVSNHPNRVHSDEVAEALAEYDLSGSLEAGDASSEIKNHQHRGVPYYDVEASAHIAEVLDGGDRQPEFYIDFQPFNDCTAYLTVYGDSMYPAIQSGEVIAVKEIKTLDVLLWGEKYLVITTEEANSLRTVKLVHQHEDDSKVILRASNPNFKGDTVIRKESIVKMFLVKGKISRGHL